MPLQATSGAASYDAFGGGGAAVEPNYIESVFSTYLYTGTGALQTITNNIDLSTKGGLVWLKSRSATYNHYLQDTTRGIQNTLTSNDTSAQSVANDIVNSTSTSGFVVQSYSGGNNSGSTYASWTFRKQPKFFDVVTWTGTGGSRTITTALNGTTGCIILKRTDTSDQWWVVHRSGANGFDSYGILNQTAAFTATGSEISSVTDTSFTISSYYNGSGSTWVAYIFAHNAGGFGLTGTDNVISCGSYTGTGTAGNAVTLGYEPQWVLIKRTDTAGNNWLVQDVMRGIPNAGSSFYLYPNTSDAETDGGVPTVIPTATGFTLPSYGSWNANGGTFIYIAIRRGPMKVPTTGTSVFAPVARTGTDANAIVSAGFPSDFALIAPNVVTSAKQSIYNRLTANGVLYTTSTNAESASGTTVIQANPWDNMLGIGVGSGNAQTNSSSYTYANYLMRRAPSFMDVVCYTGTGSARTVSHNLAAVPEMAIIKCRSNLDTTWNTYHTGLAYFGNGIDLQLTDAVRGAGPFSAAPTATLFTPQTGGGTFVDANASGNTYVAYLFATCSGVSKVGTYTGTGALQTVNCGFTGGARFVLIKRKDSTGDWWTYDSARGISSGNDPYLFLNSTAAEVTSTNYVDTDSTGFKVTAAAPAGLNASGGTYIFLAIA